MFPSPPILLLGEAAGQVWIGVLILTGFALAAVLAWQLSRARKDYALAMAENARRLSEEREKAEQAREEKALTSRESQAKSQMLATLSREIRAHLNGIIGSADLMLESAPKSQDREHLTTLRTSAESLHQSLNDVLDFSRIETGQLEIAHALFDLRQPLVEVVEHVSPLALLKELEVVLIIAPDVPLLVSGDVARVRQVLLNLMSNAVRSTAKGRVVLRVERASGPDGLPAGKLWLQFSVSDTGPGIPDEMQERLFDPSMLPGAASPRQFGGSGLELAVSKRLVELMGGRIAARNLPETGAEFSVALPVEAENIAAPAGEVVPPGLHVVILAELAASRVAVSAMLTRLGVEHDVTDTIPKAAEFLRDAVETDGHAPVLLVDESLLQTRGSELVAALTADALSGAIRVVLMSRTPDTLPKSASDVPLTAVLRKPLLIPELLLEACRRPAGAATTRVTSSRAPFTGGEGVPAAPRRGPIVLVVDDDEISRYVSAQLLTRLGCEVDLAVSGSEAVERAQKTPFDLIFMDCQMPEMDGFATTQHIRTAAGDKAPPIVALTANISEADRERCFAVGMCDFVGKPVRKAELLRVLKRWIHDRGVAAK